MIKLFLALCVSAVVARALPARSLVESSLEAAIPERQHGTVENGREMVEKEAGEDKQRQSFFLDMPDTMPEFVREKNSSEWTDSEKAEFEKWREPYKKKSEATLKKYDEVLKELNMTRDDLVELDFENPVSLLFAYKLKDIDFGRSFTDELELMVDYGLIMFYRLTGECPPKDSEAAAKLGFEAPLQIRHYCFNEYGYFSKDFKESISKPYVVIHDQFKQVHKDVADALKAADKDGRINKKSCKENIALFEDEKSVKNSNLLKLNC